MPNNIKNQMLIVGTNEQIIELRNYIRGDNGEMDFHKIYPMPTSILETSEKLNGISFNSSEKIKKGFRVSLLALKKDPGLLDLYLMGKALDETGYASWYDWSIEHWGTKWNAYSTEILTHSTLKWETAWAPVDDLIKVLSEKFPEVILVYWWCEEVPGEGGEEIHFKAGDRIYQNEPVRGSKEDYELFFFLKPDRKEGYKLINGEYVDIEE